MKVDEKVWLKWQKWVGMIEADLQQGVDDQAMFDVFSGIVEENSTWIDSLGGGAFVDLVRRNFVASAFMAIRRQLKADDKDSVSLIRLLTEIAAQAHQLTYEFYLVAHPLDPHGWEWQRGVFDKLSDDRQVVSQAIIENDIAEARGLSAKIEEIADRQIAHLDRRGTEAKVTFDDLRTSLSHFDDLAVKYILFFTGISYAEETLKARLAFDPQEIFRNPLIKPTPALLV